MAKLVGQVELEVVVDLDSVHLLEIELESIQSQNQDVRQGFYSCSEPHILLGAARLAVYIVVAFHRLGCQEVHQGLIDRFYIFNLELQIVKLLDPLSSDRTVSA